MHAISDDHDQLFRKYYHKARKQTMMPKQESSANVLTPKMMLREATIMIRKKLLRKEKPNQLVVEEI